MSQTIIVDGEEKEVFTQEELEAQKEEAINQYKEENPDKSDELTKLEEELEKAKQELEGFKDKDMNFANMRNKISEKEKEAKDLKVSIDEKINTVKKEILEGVMKDHYNDTLEKLVGNDKELKEKVELQYKRLADTASTKVELSKKLNDAFVLATGGTKESFDNSVFSSGSAGAKIQSKSEEKFSSEEQELLNKLSQAGNVKLQEDKK
jgi:alanyl-tRNA synthetase